VNELDQIWESICKGEFKGEFRPQKVFANKDTQIMCIPSEAGANYTVYERKKGGEWTLLPSFRKQA
jgi:hypothetical protein